MNARLFVRQIEGALSRLASPTYSSCFRCGRTWNTCRNHSTPYSWHTPYPGGVKRPASACFPLCEDCWGELTRAQRLPYYRQMFDEWESGGECDHNGVSWEETWERISESVMAGL